MISDYNKYSLIGIGDFSHGDNNIWEYRINLIKYLLKHTKQKIFIYNEDTNENTKNILENKKLSYYKSYGIYKGFPFGKLTKYCFRVYDSPIYLQFIKLIRKNKNRIFLFGVDNGKLDRDKEMSQKILNHLNQKNINLFFAHNNHINNQKIIEKYETKNEKYRCGYYLKQKLKNKYLIILSTGYEGKIRFDCHCSNIKCDERIFYEIPIFKSVKIKEYKNIKEGLYKNFDNIVNFTACDFKENNSFISKTNGYVLFFKNIKPLKLL